MFQIGDCVMADLQGRRVLGRVGGLELMPHPLGGRHLFVTVLSPTPVTPRSAKRHPAGYALVARHVQARAVAAGFLRRIRCPNIDHPFWRAASIKRG